MPDVLIASDAPWLRAELRSMLEGDDLRVQEAVSGFEVVDMVAEAAPDLVILDMQIGQMGGMATCLDLRLEESGGRLGHVPVLMLLDRRADVFLARRSEAEGWLVKPVDPIRLRRAVQALLEGGTYHDDSYRPESVTAGRPSSHDR